MDLSLYPGISTRDITASSTSVPPDYQAPSMTSKVVFEPNERSKSVGINIIDDTVFEAAEQFEVSLTSDVANHLEFPSTAMVTILNDDSEVSECVCLFSFVWAIFF